jgi:SAM-dependent methyltransferase
LKLQKIVFSDVGNNYDRIANYYDRIHHLFFGQAEIVAQVELLDYVRPGDRLLIVGGGTGWILERIAAVFPSGLTITYIESSVRMMALTKARNWGGNDVTFVSGVVEDWVSGEGEFDCILTGFFFDNFPEEHAVRIVEQLWQVVLLWLMYVSARLICGVEAKWLPDMERIFTERGFRLEWGGFHYQRLIRSTVYRYSGCIGSGQ